MADVSVRQLRNDVSAVLRRVEAGERLTVTVHGRPVAELIPIDPRPRSMRTDEFLRRLEDARPDAGLAAQLRELLPETTDDLPYP